MNAAGYLPISFSNPAIGETRWRAGARKKMLDDDCSLSPRNGAFVQLSDNSVRGFDEVEREPWNILAGRRPDADSYPISCDPAGEFSQ